MTPASSSTNEVVRFSPALVRAAYTDAAEDLVEIASRVQEWEQAGLGIWSLRDLAGHASRGLSTVIAYLDAGTGKAIELDHPFDYFAAYRTAYADPADIAARARKSGRDLGPDPAVRIADLCAEATARVKVVDDDAPVAGPAGVMRLVDYLPCRIYELTVHSGDMAAAIGGAFEARPGPLLIASLFTAALAATSPDAMAVLMALNGRRPLPERYSAI